MMIHTLCWTQLISQIPLQVSPSSASLKPGRQLQVYDPMVLEQNWLQPSVSSWHSSMSGFHNFMTLSESKKKKTFVSTYHYTQGHHLPNDNQIDMNKCSSPMCLCMYEHIHVCLLCTHQCLYSRQLSIQLNL